MTRLDGNAIAGELFDIFGEEMTTATATCAGCGSTRPLGELAVYLQTLVDYGDVNRLLADLGCGPACRMAAGFSEEELGPKNRVNILTADDTVRLLSVVKDDPHYADLVLALKNNLRNNRMPALLPEHVAVIHKTGSLDGVSNDAGIVQDDQVEFIVAFFTEGQSDPIQASTDIASCTLRLYDRLIAV